MARDPMKWGRCTNKVPLPSGDTCPKQLSKKWFQIRADSDFCPDCGERLITSSQKNGPPQAIWQSIWQFLGRAGLIYALGGLIAAAAIGGGVLLWRGDLGQLCLFDCGPPPLTCKTPLEDRGVAIAALAKRPDLDAADARRTALLLRDECGDPESAMRLLRTLADRGDTAAVLEVARTYDPTRTASSDVSKAEPAYLWYRCALNYPDQTAAAAGGLANLKAWVTAHVNDPEGRSAVLPQAAAYDLLDGWKDTPVPPDSCISAHDQADRGE
jgi:hypothetical protein